jgi:hypothetical protein
LIGGIRRDINQHVIAAPGSVENRYAIGRATHWALAGLAFEDHDDRWGDSS